MIRRLVFTGLLIIVLQDGLFAKKDWYDFQSGLEIAKNENKHVIIDFYTDWCHWCKVMDKETFSVPSVETYLFDNFVPVRINAESDKDTVTFNGSKFTYRELTRLFQVTGYPSIALLTPSAEVITVVPGYIKKDMFINILKFIQEECYKTEVSFDEFIKTGCSDQGKK